MEIRKVPLDQLQPAPYNPRVPLEPGSPGYRRLERSLREFDLVQPIVWNEQTGHIVAGHQRVEILKHRGETDVDAVVVHLPLEREKALNITLNNAQVGSDWDAGKLVDVLAELDRLEEFDATLTGFDENDLQDLLFAPAAETAPPDEEEEAAEPCVRVVLEIPPAQWDDVQPELDEIIARHDLVAHIQMPR